MTTSHGWRTAIWCSIASIVVAVSVVVGGVLWYRSERPTYASSCEIVLEETGGALAAMGLAYDISELSCRPDYCVRYGGLYGSGVSAVLDIELDPASHDVAFQRLRQYWDAREWGSDWRVERTDPDLFPRGGNRMYLELDRSRWRGRYLFGLHHDDREPPFSDPDLLTLTARGPCCAR